MLPDPGHDVVTTDTHIETADIPTTPATSYIHANVAKSVAKSSSKRNKKHRKKLKKMNQLATNDPTSSNGVPVTDPMDTKGPSTRDSICPGNTTALTALPTIDEKADEADIDDCNSKSTTKKGAHIDRPNEIECGNCEELKTLYWCCKTVSLSSKRK